jgi:hypothetical protein
MKTALKVSCGSALFALALGTIGLGQALAANATMQSVTNINLQVAGSLTMSCDDATALAIPAGIGGDAAPIACEVRTNGSSGYVIDATASARLQGQGLASQSAINRIAASPTYNAGSAVNDGATNAWGLYNASVSPLTSCDDVLASYEGTTDTVWGVQGQLIDHTNGPAETDGDNYKFCVAAYLNTPVTGGIYTGTVTFTATSID